MSMFRPAKESPIRIVFHKDEQTPRDFVVALLKDVFGQREADVAAFMDAADRDDPATVGPYAPDVAEMLLRTAQQRIMAKGHPLRLEAEPLSRAADDGCAFCGASVESDRTFFEGQAASICEDCALKAARHVAKGESHRQFKYAHEALAWHFAGFPRDQIVTTARRFPGHMRPDVQVALDSLYAAPLRFFGVFEQFRYETMTFAGLMKEGQHAATIAPAQYQDVDIGDDRPVRCLVNGLWLCRESELPYAVLLSFHREYNQESGMCIEIAVPVGAEGSAFTQRCFAAIEASVNAARSYRGKLLSLDSDADYRGRSKGIQVHKLMPVAADEVILPAETLKLLDRNVFRFVAGRAGLRSLGQSTRKGILLYGPPGTGKTHTIRYLASNLPEHTTLLITAGQMGALGDYMNLARLLQPSLVVIEDVDLIARARENMNGPCEEALLNRLLNEMDGLKEDADIMFVLTTNRPEQLEAALTGRPGRIDQAIEVPLPDAAGRAKLVALYGRGLELDASLLAEAVSRTDGVSGAFIKEMMRRAAQAALGRNAGRRLNSTDLDSALNDMLFTGGRLNAVLLGGRAAPSGSLH